MPEVNTPVVINTTWQRSEEFHVGLEAIVLASDGDRHNVLISSSVDNVSWMRTSGNPDPRIRREALRLAAVIPQEVTGEPESCAHRVALDLPNIPQEVTRLEVVVWPDLRGFEGRFDWDLMNATVCVKQLGFDAVEGSKLTRAHFPQNKGFHFARLERSEGDIWTVTGPEQLRMDRALGILS